MGKELHYFACGNTAKGFQNLFRTNLTGLNKIYLLKGGPGTGKSTMMKKVGAFYFEKDYDVEYINCSSDPDSLDGVIVRDLGFGIVDATAPHVIEPTAPGAIEEYINLGTSWDTKLLAKHTKEILKLQGEIKENYPKAYKCFKEALNVHDEWEKIYITHMDLDEANALAKEMIQVIFEDKNIKKPSEIRHRFFGATSPNGSVDFVENITENIETRYFIKGRPGTGKSTMLKMILANAEIRGYDVNVYHCGFDPDSLDMLEFPELNVCIFDSTAPHEYYPSREGDIIVDVYKRFVEEGTDEKYEKELVDIVSRYKALVKEGTTYLAKAKSLHDELESYYIDATNFKVINQIYKELLAKIENL